MDTFMDVENVEGLPSLTVLRLHGRLDGSNFESLIKKGKSLYTEGVHALLLDMSDLTFMSSAGMVALHSLVLTMRGEASPNLEEGWEAMRSISRDVGSIGQNQVKLLGPQAKVLNTLQISGMDRFFEIYTSETEAIKSFG